MPRQFRHGVERLRPSTNFGSTLSLSQIGSLTLPGIDWPSVAAVARLLSESGIRSQLEALEIGEDSLLCPGGWRSVEAGIGLSRKSLELITLLAPIYQEYASGQWQARVDKRLGAQPSALEI